MNLFIHSNGAPHSLHSFPTRRSSDLSASVSGPRSSTSIQPLSQDEASTRGTGTPAVSSSAEVRRKRVRSEEHTSELQSPCNLVCRLLLEKKKTKHKNNINKIHVIYTD